MAVNISETTNKVVVTESGIEIVSVAVQGPQGPRGEGIPTGGLTGQILRKATDSDYDTEWQTASGTGDMVAATYDTNTDGIVDRADVADAVEWANVQSKPATFTPSAHTHLISEVTNLQTELNAKASSTHSHTSSDINSEAATNGQVLAADGVGGASWQDVAGGGSGDMTKTVYDANDDGKVDEADYADAAPWAGITSKPATFPPDSHTHTKAQITDFAHNHAISEVTNLQTTLDGKEPVFTKNTGFNKNFGTVAGTVAEGSHTHDAAYAAISHTHTKSEITDFSHTHTKSEITDFAHTHIPSEVGLGNVTNDAQVRRTEMGAANGVATLNASGVIPSAQIPPVAIGEVFVVADYIERGGLTVQEGDIAKVTSDGLTYIYDGTDWVQITTLAGVDSVNGYTGTVNLTTNEIPESGALYFTNARADARIQNTINDTVYGSDLLWSSNKIATELTTKANTTHSHAISDVTNLQTSLDAKADTSHTHTEADITDLGNYTLVGHTHTISDVTDYVPANRITGQSGGTDSRVVRISGSNTWVDASQTDTIDQLRSLAWKQSGIYYTYGSVVPVSGSGLTAGTVYYLDTAGNLTATPPTPSSTVRLVPIGTALDIGSLYFTPGTPIGGE